MTATARTTHLHLQPVSLWKSRTTGTPFFEKYRKICNYCSRIYASWYSMMLFYTVPSVTIRSPFRKQPKRLITMEDVLTTILLTTPFSHGYRLRSCPLPSILSKITQGKSVTCLRAIGCINCGVLLAPFSRAQEFVRLGK